MIPLRRVIETNVLGTGAGSIDLGTETTDR